MVIQDVELSDFDSPAGFWLASSGHTTDATELEALVARLSINTCEAVLFRLILENQESIFAIVFSNAASCDY